MRCSLCPARLRRARRRSSSHPPGTRRPSGQQVPGHSHPTVTPPQTNSVCPVTNPVLGSQKKLTASATSSGVPILPKGTRSTIAFVSGASGGLFFQNAVVAMGPGATQFTVMPDGASSRAQVRAIDCNAPLLALWRARLFALGDAARVHDDPAVAGLAHARHERLGADDRRCRHVDVHRGRRNPRSGRLVEQAGHDDPDIVDEAGDGVARGDLASRVGRSPGVGQVDAASILRQRGRLGCLDVEHEDAESVLLQAQCDGLADVAGSAGDDGARFVRHARDPRGWFRAGRMPARPWCKPRPRRQAGGGGKAFQRYAVAIWRAGWPFRMKPV